MCYGEHAKLAEEEIDDRRDADGIIPLWANQFAGERAASW